MKKYILIPTMMLTAIVVFAAAANAQQKCSDKPIATEFRKVREKQEARKQMLQKTQQDPVPTPGISTSSPQTKPKPNNKPSTQPMSIPSRKRKQ
jgi:high-affinity K+ transport system ATPase subunit B